MKYLPKIEIDIPSGVWVPAAELATLIGKVRSINAGIDQSRPYSYRVTRAAALAVAEQIIARLFRDQAARVRAAAVARR